MAKSWEKPWSIEEIVENAPKWTLAGDAGLLHHLEVFSENLLANADRTNENLNKLLDDLNESSIKVDLVKNEFLGLQNTQFIESRVYEDDETLDTSKEKKVEKQDTKNEATDAMKCAVLEGLDILDKYYDKVSVPASDSEDEDGERYFLRMKDPYLNRPLPYLIGSKEWHEKWHAGLVESSSESEDEQIEEKYSDTDSESNLPITDRRGISTSDSGTDISNRVEKPVASSTFNDTLASSDSEDYTNSIPAKPPISNLNFAEQLAARLGNVAVQSSKEHSAEIPVNKNPILKAPVHTTVIGDILSDEPPPLDNTDDGLFTSKSGQGMFSGGDGLFDGSDDDTDYFSGKRVSGNKRKTPVESQKAPNLFDDNGEDGIFSQKIEPKGEKSKMINRGLFDEEESDDDIFATNNKPQPALRFTQSSNTIPFIPDEPPELVPSVRKPVTSRNVPSAQSNESEISEKSSNSNAESGDAEADNRLLINAKQKPKKVGLFDDPGDLFKDDLFSDASLFGTNVNTAEKAMKEKKKLKLFDDEDDKQTPAESKSNFPGDSNTAFFEDKKNTFSGVKTEDNNVAKVDMQSTDGLFGSDDDLFKSNNSGSKLFNSTARKGNNKKDVDFPSSQKNLFGSPNTDLFSNRKAGLFDSPVKSNIFDSPLLKQDEPAAKSVESLLKSDNSNANKSEVIHSEKSSKSDLFPAQSTQHFNSTDLFSSSANNTNEVRNSGDGKLSKDLFSSLDKSEESWSMFDDDGWDEPPPVENSSGKKTITRNLFDEDSSDDDLFASKPVLSKLVEKKTRQSNINKFEEKAGKSQDSVGGTASTLQECDVAGRIQGSIEGTSSTLQVHEVAEKSQKDYVHTLEKDDAKEKLKSQNINSLNLETNVSEGVSQNDKVVPQAITKHFEKDTSEPKEVAENVIKTLKEPKTEVKNKSLEILENSREDAGPKKKPPVASRNLDGKSLDARQCTPDNLIKSLNKTDLLQNKLGGKPDTLPRNLIEDSKTFTSDDQPQNIDNSKMSTTEDHLPNILEESNRSNKVSRNLIEDSIISQSDDDLERPVKTEPEPSIVQIPAFSLFNDTPPDIDWDTKSDTNIYDDEDLFDDIPVSSQKATIFDREPPSLEPESKSRTSLFDEDDDEVPSKDAHRVLGLFEDKPTFLDFTVKSSLNQKANNDEADFTNKFGHRDPNHNSTANTSKPMETNSSKGDKSVLVFDNESPDDGIFAKMSKPPLADRKKLVKSFEDRKEIVVNKPDVKKVDDSGDIIAKKKESPGKLKHNLNINVNALMPGASLPWKKDTSSMLNKSRSLEESQEITDTQESLGLPHAHSCKDMRVTPEQNVNSAESVETLHSITKSRARIQSKRKPSTRRARQALMKKNQDEEIQPEDNNNSPQLSDSNILDDLNSNSSLQAEPLDNTGSSNPNNNNPQDLDTSQDDPEHLFKPVQKISLKPQESPRLQSRNKSKLSTKEIKSSSKTNSSLFDDLDSDTDIFADKKQKVKDKNKHSLFGDADDSHDLFSSKDFKKSERDDSKKELFEDDVDMFAPKKVTGKKGSLFADLSEDEDIFGTGTAHKSTGKSFSTAERKPVRNRNLLRKSEERQVVHDPLDALSNKFND